MSIVLLKNILAIIDLMMVLESAIVPKCHCEHECLSVSLCYSATDCQYVQGVPRLLPKDWLQLTRGLQLVSGIENE